VICEFSAKRDIPLWAFRSLLGHCMQLDLPSFPAQPDKLKKWPIVVFDSGIWGTCEMYTQFCRDLASLGMIVIALEHEDGSGIYATKSGTGEKIDYVDPPEGDDGDLIQRIVEFRRPFLEFRNKELSAAMQAIKHLAAAEAPSESPLAKVLSTGDGNDLLLVGHSFGAASALFFMKGLSERGAECPFRSALLMDLWPEPLPLDVTSFTPPVPIGMIVSTEWADKPKFLQRNLDVAKSAGKQCLAALHIRGTLHQWISETQLILPCWVLKKIGMMHPSANGQKPYQVTMQAVQQLLEAFRSPQAQEQLTDNLRKLDPEAVELLSMPEA